MNILAFISFSNLFFTATAFILLSYIMINSDRPWEIDQDDNIQRLLKIYSPPQKFENFIDFFDYLGPHKDQTLQLILFFYRFMAVMGFTTAFYLLFIIFLASKNRALIIAAHVVNLVFFSLLLLNLDNLSNSRHTKLYYTLFITNATGLLSSLLNVIKEYYGKNIDVLKDKKEVKTE
eukprot:TRINITY_DN9655_c0_g1_i1.p1 TRINITY_DN9655_c0_g1~~TRINITY_DN9655_c0_g1_i1.p1  ORF type:complete len:177 (+),score=23.77 TRINITY_DN9655_c0_g1_i1:36-566(+)